MLPQLYLEDQDNGLDHSETAFFMKSHVADADVSSVPAALGLSKARKMQLVAMMELPCFSGLKAHLKSNTAAWASFCDPLQDAAKVSQSQAGGDEEHKEDINEHAPVFAALPDGWHVGADAVHSLWAHMLAAKVRFVLLAYLCFVH